MITFNKVIVKYQWAENWSSATQLGCYRWYAQLTKVTYHIGNISTTAVMIIHFLLCLEI